MKVRLGFVSNSSSSSFICAYKGNLKSEINNLFKGFPLKSFPAGLFDIIKKSNKIITVKDLSTYAKDNYIDEDDDEYIDLLKYINDGFSIYTGFFSDEEYGLESYLCWENINIDTDTFKLKSKEGY